MYVYTHTHLYTPSVPPRGEASAARVEGERQVLHVLRGKEGADRLHTQIQTVYACDTDIYMLV
jgi:hypothetical protein